MVGGSWNLQFLVSLPYRCYVPNLVKIGSVVLEKKMLTDDTRRRTPTHSNRSPEWLRWPKYYNLKIFINCIFKSIQPKFFTVKLLTCHKKNNYIHKCKLDLCYSNSPFVPLFAIIFLFKTITSITNFPELQYDVIFN